MRIVYIEWLDSKFGLDTWEYREKYKSDGPARIKTVGIVIEEEENFITVAHSISTTQVTGSITIPMACILRMKTIKRLTKDR